jgi:tetratricopeptide (TPR) repeat protein
VVAFSNRAMAFIKLKEYHRAISDCTYALKIDSNHIKSLHRRATAYNFIGMHRNALQDLAKAEALDPSSKAIHLDTQKTRELLRNSVNRAPLMRLQSPSFIDGLLE